MPRRKQSISRKRKAAPAPPRYPKRVRPLKDQEIYENLVAESDDDCSNFDDDEGDPDFFIQSDCDTNSEQSDNEEDHDTLETVNAQTEGFLQQGSSSHSDIEEGGSESGDERPQSRVDQSQSQDPVTLGTVNTQTEGVLQQASSSHSDIVEAESDSGAESTQSRVDQSQNQERSTVERLRYFYGKNRHKWSSAEPSRTTRVRLHNIVSIDRQVRPPELTSFGDAWKLFFTDDMLDRIVEHTNGKLIEYRAKFKDTDRSELVPMSNIELKAFIGLLFYSSVFHSNHENAEFIFATDGTGREIFRCVMSKNRFLVLLNCLRFDDSSTRTERLKTDTLAAISELFNEFIKNCKQNFTLGTHVCIDEMLVGFRGRCKFRMYMPNKPTKYGLKVLLLVDCDTFYVYNAYIYHGKGSDSKGLNDAEKKLGIPSQSVIRLCKGIENSNRNITADNWFTSIELLNALKERGLTYLGTIKKNKREIPPEFQAHKDRTVGSSLFGFTADHTIVSYVTKPKKAVILVSSMHHNKDIDVETGKPVMIIDYNKTKGGVDEVDKKCSIYSCSRRTRRWPMVLFYRLLDMSGVNAYILYNKCSNQNRTTRGQFLLALARELVLPVMKLRVYNDRLPRELRLTIERVIGPADMPEPPTEIAINTEPGVRKTCAICPSRLKRRTKYSCCKCNKPMCLSCCLQICSDCKLGH